MATSTDFDLIIRNGKVIDGTGAPAFTADVAIKDGKIAAVGKISGRVAEEIDASGKLVTPGFVDIHTHYDGQAVWDRSLAPGSWHGVTTVVMGNCGVGFAPVRPGDHNKLIELMEGVEDIPAPCLHAGLDWKWESFGEYLDALDRHGRDVDICAQLPHSALRVYVMGDRAVRLENATPEDIQQMQKLTTEAMRAGAFGFSTSRSVTHKTATGDHIPSLRAQEEELTGIAMGMAEAGKGQLQIIIETRKKDIDTDFAMVRNVVKKSGRPCVFSLAQRHEEPETWKEIMDLSDRAIEEGLSIRPVFPPRPIGLLFGLTGSQNPFSGAPSYQAIADLPLPERVAIMRDPEFRARLLSEDPYSGSSFALMPRLGGDKVYCRMFLFGDTPDYEPPREQSVSAIAEREGRSPREVAYDFLLQEEGHSFLYCMLANYANYNLDATATALANRNTLIGLGDGGAHVGFISDASFPTYLLTWWGRDRPQARQPIEELVRRQTSDTAHSIGLYDRGVIRAGMKADLNVIDFEALTIEKPYMVFDLPGGGRRLLQKARGYELTVLSGVITYRKGEFTGSTPGRLVRGPQEAAV